LPRPVGGAAQRRHRILIGGRSATRALGRGCGSNDGDRSPAPPPGCTGCTGCPPAPGAGSPDSCRRLAPKAGYPFGNESTRTIRKGPGSPAHDHSCEETHHDSQPYVHDPRSTIDDPPDTPHPHAHAHAHAHEQSVAAPAPILGPFPHEKPEAYRVASIWLADGLDRQARLSVDAGPTWACACACG
jgi:hypothetical protein